MGWHLRRKNQAYPEEGDERRPRRFQFTIRALLITTLLASCILSWFSVQRGRAQRQQEAISEIQKFGGVAWYDFQWQRWANDWEGCGPEIALRNAEYDLKPGAGSWLSGIFGEDFVSDVVAIDVTPTLNDDLQEACLDDALANLRFFPKLRELRLDGGRLTKSGFEQIRACEQLEKLAILRSEIDGKDLRYLQSMPKLDTLEIDAKLVLDQRDLAFLQQLPALRKLWIEDSEIKTGGLRSLEPLSHLAELSLWRSSVDAQDVVHLRGLTRLRYLDLSHTGVRGESLSHLQLLHQLTCLHLDGLGIRDADLSYLSSMTRLEVLTLEDARITDEGLVHLQPLQSLVSITLSKTLISPKGLAHLEFPNLEVLNIYSTPRIAGSGLLDWKGLRRLKRLVVSRGKLTDEQRDRLAALVPQLLLDERPDRLSPREPW